MNKNSKQATEILKGTTVVVAVSKARHTYVGVNTMPVDRATVWC